MNTTIRVDDHGLSQVGWTRNGIDFRPVGEAFAKPRQAIDYSMELEGWGPRRAAATTAGLGAEIALRAEQQSGDGGPNAQRASQRVTTSPATRPSVDASSLDAGESGGNRRTPGSPVADPSPQAAAAG